MSDREQPGQGDGKPERLAEFENVVKEFESALLRYATRLVNSRNAAEDIVQSTFIKLYRSWDKDAHPTAQLSSWLYRVTHNGAVDFLRKETRRRSLHRRHAEEQPWSCAPRTGPRVSEQAEKARAQLRRLSLRDQQVVILKVFEEKSYREISEITGLTESNVGYILHHAMKKMAAGLDRHKPGTDS